MQTCCKPHFCRKTLSNYTSLNNNKESTIHAYNTNKLQTNFTLKSKQDLYMYTPTITKSYIFPSPFKFSSCNNLCPNLPFNPSNYLCFDASRYYRLQHTSQVCIKWTSNSPSILSNVNTSSQQIRTSSTRQVCKITCHILLLKARWKNKWPLPSMQCRQKPQSTSPQYPYFYILSHVPRQSITASQVIKVCCAMAIEYQTFLPPTS